MQTAETLNQGLKRAYTLTIPAAEIEARIEGQVATVASQVRMPGFRPGKVPANLVRKMHGPALQQEALNASVQEGVQQLLTEQQLRPAMQPSVELSDGYEHGKDAEVKVELEVLPDVGTPNIEGLKLERLQVEPGDSEIDEAVNRIAGQQKSFDAAPEGHVAAKSDAVVLDYSGSVDGVKFEGGTGEGMQVELGSGQLIPGFEDQLVGIKAGESHTLNVTFPADYNVENLKGKPAVFEVTATEVRTPKQVVADDDFAKQLGLESVGQLRDILKGQLEQELNGMTRMHLKRQLLDRLAETHDFEVPPSMVEAEFGQIRGQLEHEASHEEDPAAALAQIEAEAGDYRRIAERRVRLGLLLSEIGQQAGVQVSQQEMNRLIAQEAQRYRGQEAQVAKYFQENPMAAAQLRAPLYEDKVVDHLLESAEISDRSVSRTELQAAIEADEDGHVHGPDCGHEHDHGHGAEKKPSAGKAAKPAASGEAAAEGASEAKPAKKPAAKKAASTEAPAAEGDVGAQPAKRPAAKKAAPKKASTAE
jgi:trigger factor